jgi:hypothetical protein
MKQGIGARLFPCPDRQQWLSISFAILNARKLQVFLMITLALLFNPSLVPLKNASDAMPAAKLPTGARAGSRQGAARAPVDNFARQIIQSA